MTQASVDIQIAPESLPTLPCWFAEVAIVAQSFTTSGVLQAIEAKKQLFLLLDEGTATTPPTATSLAF